MNRRIFAIVGSVGVVALVVMAWQRNPFAVWAVEPAGVPAIRDADYATLKSLVPPKPEEELFTTLPWETSLWAGRTKAAASGKPILIWSMDGHPLGCG